MDPIANPFSPGAGMPPPELVGREALLESSRVTLERVRAGRGTKSLLMVGLRGVGKTVLLNRIRRQAVEAGLAVVELEAPEGRSLPAMLAPELNRSLIALSRTEKARELAKRARRALAAFVPAMRLKYADVELQLDLEPEPELAGSGDFYSDLRGLLRSCGEAAKAADSVLAITIDELQYVERDQMAVLITALHDAAQRRLPITLLGAGLPQLRGQMGKAKSYAERMFNFPEIGPLPPDAARDALEIPIRAAGVEIENAAVERIQGLTQGYPYFLQEWGAQTWLAATGSRITAGDVASASEAAIAALDQDFFGVRFDRCTPRERAYLRAMAELGPGPFRSGEIAEAFGRSTQSLGPLRSSLIQKGMIYSPAHGDTAFTVPLFDGYLKRVMPVFEREG